VVALLLERGGAQQLRAKNNGWLPIHYAARFNSSADVVALLVRTANSNSCGPWQLAAKNRDGSTPLALAELHHRPEAIQALLRPPATAEVEEVGEEEEEEKQKEQEQQVVVRGGGRAELLEFLGLRAGATPTEILAEQAAATDGVEQEEEEEGGREAGGEEEEETMYQRLAKRRRCI
jgi:hypothetical protein